MSDKTPIQWTAKINADGKITLGATWNPIAAFNIETDKRGWFCIKKSPGCAECYAEKWNLFRGNGLKYIASNLKKIEFRTINLDQPLRWKESRNVFTDSMFDLFLPAISSKLIDPVFASIALSHHTHIILTKHPERMCHYFSVEQSDWDFLREADSVAQDWALIADREGMIYQHLFDAGWVIADYGNEEDGADLTLEYHGKLPLPNVILGASVEDQERANERRKYMRELSRQGWKTCVSYEPALSAIDWSGWEFIDWMIAGGESGKGARPPHPGWFSDTRDWCIKNQIPFHFKQWGEYGQYDDQKHYKRVNKSICVFPDGTVMSNEEAFSRYADKPWWMLPLGKDKSGRLLDGREWNEFPDLNRNV